MIGRSRCAQGGLPEVRLLIRPARGDLDQQQRGRPLREFSGVLDVTATRRGGLVSTPSRVETAGLGTEA